MTKIQYHEDSNTLWQYFISNERCNCGCNVFHHEYDGKDIYVTCNACNEDFAIIKSEYVNEELSKGVWR